MTPNPTALQRTRPSRPACNPRVPRAGSLSLGRYATEATNGFFRAGYRGERLCGFHRESAQGDAARISTTDLAEAGGPLGYHLVTIAPE